MEYVVSCCIGLTISFLMLSILSRKRFSYLPFISVIDITGGFIALNQEPTSVVLIIIGAVCGLVAGLNYCLNWLNR